jgi:hypothetical protein
MSEYLGALATVAAAGMSYLGGQDQNKANAAQAGNQMRFQQDMFNQQSAYNWDMVHSNENFQREMAGKQMDFQSGQIDKQADFAREVFSSAKEYNTEMANTAMQRRMADLKAAGLNPMLTINQGGAAAPSVAAPSIGAASGASGSGSTMGVSAPSGAMARMENIISPAVASALQAGRTIQELRAISANIANTEAETAFREQETRRSSASTARELEQTLTEPERRRLIGAQANTERDRPALVRAQSAESVARADQARQQAEGQSIDNTDRMRYGRGPAADVIATGIRSGHTIANSGPEIREALRNGGTSIGRLFDGLRSLLQ